MGAVVTVLVLLFCPGIWAQNSSTDTECSLSEEHRADVVLLLDGFNHISPDDFSRVRDSLKTLVPMLGPVGSDLLRVSLVKYGRDPEVELDLSTFQNLSSVVGAVSRMSQSLPLPGGSTDNALYFIWRNIFPKNHGERENIPNILILITDRNSSGVSPSFLSALWHSNVKVFVVGVKVTDELKIKKKDHDVTEVFTVEDFNNITYILKELSQSFCRWLKEKLGRTQPASLSFTDVQPRRAQASWECHSRQVDHFFLFVYLDDSGSYVGKIWVLGHKRSAEIPHLLPNTTYRIQVTAVESAGQSNPEIGLLTTPADQVRLSGGPGRCSGSLAVLMNQSWSSVCGRGFGRSEAAVVCEELDCGAVSELHQGALIPEGPAVGRSFICEGAETSLKECESSETLCSTAANLSCSDAVLMCDGFRCAGYVELRYKDKRRPMTTEDLDLDFGSALCEQMGCGSAVSVKYHSVYHGLLWRLDPECVKQRSGLTNCLDLDSHTSKTGASLYLLCSEIIPVIRTSVSSEGVSVSSEGVSVSSEGVSVSSQGVSVSSQGVLDSSQGVSRVQSVLLKLGSTFSVSCSLDEPFVPVQLHLQSPTGNYMRPAVNHSAHFLFQDFSPAHIGNYTCVYCMNNTFATVCLESMTLYITPGAPHSHLMIKAGVFIVSLLLWAIALFCYFKRCRGQRNPTRRSRSKRPSAEDNMIQMVPLYKPLQPQKQ